MAAAAAAVCVPTPPLIPTPTPPLLPTPTPTPPPSACAPERKIAKPGRASLSRNWSHDKLVARVTSSLPGRASLSADWNKDKSDMKDLSRKRSSSGAPSFDRFKKPKVCYGGPGFIESPDPKELPIPNFIRSPRPSELPMPSFLKASKQ